MITVGVLAGGQAYVDLFRDIEGVKVLHIPNNSPAKDIMYKVRDIDILCLTGGHDVSPTFYNEPVGKYTTISTRRDRIDKFAVISAISNGKRMVGICRGAQFLCAMAGGSLVQDISNHAISGTHKIKTNHGDIIDVTSTHHQMMSPLGTKHTMLAWAEGLSSYYYDGRNRPHEMYAPLKGAIRAEPEAIWFEDLYGLAVQFHPENMDSNSMGRKYFRSLLDEYILP